MRKILSIGLCAMMIMGSMVIFIDVDPKVNAEVTVESPMYTSRGPIEISSDAEFTAVNGVTGGNGIPGDPYIIEGWEIDATGVNYGIYIISTTANFIVRDCLIHDLDLYALSFYNVQNAQIQNCTFLNCIGFRISGTMITFNDNQIINCTANEFIGCNYVLIYNNTISSAETGYLELFCSAHVTLWDNSFNNSGVSFRYPNWTDMDSLEISLNNTVNTKPIYYYKNTPNLVINNSLAAGQVILYDCPSSTITGVNYSNTATGITVTYSDDVTLADSGFESDSCEGTSIISCTNVIIDNIIAQNCSGHGIDVWDSSLISLTDSKFISNNAGIVCDMTHNSSFDNNSISGSSWGMSVSRGSDLVVENMTVYDNSYYGISVSATKLSIFKNIIVENNSHGLSMSYLQSSDSNLFTNVTARNNEFGIVFNTMNVITKNTTLECSNIYDNEVGVFLSSMEYLDVVQNEIIGNDIGIMLSSSDENIIQNNVLDCNKKAFYAIGSNNNTIKNNSITNSSFGLELSSSHNNHVQNNTFDSILGYHFFHDYYSYSDQEVFQNDANWANYSTFQEQMATGQLGVEPLYTKSVLVENATMLYTHIVGQADCPDLDLTIFLDGKGGNPVDGITQVGEFVDIDADSDADEEITIECPKDGTYLIRVFGFDVDANPGHFDMDVEISSDNSTAISSYNSTSPIYENTLINNYIGIYLDTDTTNSIIYHNNFIGNAHHATDLGHNTWDKGVLQGGNHWDNWTTPDNNADGYVDSPLIIGNGNQDNWPFAQTWFDDNIAPTADAGSNNSIEQGEIVSFNASASLDHVGIVNYTWDFEYNGSAIKLYGMTPSFEYLYTDNYTVNLTVRDAGGNKGTDNIWVDVRDNPDDPVADAGPDVIIDQHEVVTFNASGSYSMFAIENYVWEFNYNGAAIQLYNELAQYTFNIVGNYSVNLTITAGGETSTDQMWVHVRDTTPPTAVAGDSIIIDQGTIVEFNASASSDNVGITNYTWNVSYNGTHTAFLYGISISYNFTEPGVYYVMLNVSDFACNFDTVGIVVNVNSTEIPFVDIEPPVADAGPDQEVEVGAVVTFTGAGSTDNVGIVNYTWTFTYNGSVVTLYDVSPEFQYWTIGNYTITLKVTDAEGNYETDQSIVSVTESDIPGNEGNNWWLLIAVLVIVSLVVVSLIYIKIMQNKNTKPSTDGEMEQGKDE